MRLLVVGIFTKNEETYSPSRHSERSEASLQVYERCLSRWRSLGMTNATTHSGGLPTRAPATVRRSLTCT
jgi:hypothetical protein